MKHWAPPELEAQLNTKAKKMSHSYRLVSSLQMHAISTKTLNAQG